MKGGEKEEMNIDKMSLPSVLLDDVRFGWFSTKLSTLFRNERAEYLRLQAVVEYMKQQDFNEEEVNAGMKRMEDEDKVQIEEGLVFIF